MKTEAASLTFVLGPEFLVTFLLVWIMYRERRIWDWIPLKRAIPVPGRQVRQMPKQLRDLRVGESGWMTESAVVVSAKNGRLYVRWAEMASPCPDQELPWRSLIKVERLRRGLKLTVPENIVFPTMTSVRIFYGPVVELAEESESKGALKQQLKRAPIK